MGERELRRRRKKLFEHSDSFEKPIEDFESSSPENCETEFSKRTDSMSEVFGCTFVSSEEENNCNIDIPQLSQSFDRLQDAESLLDNRRPNTPIDRCEGSSYSPRGFPETNTAFCASSMGDPYSSFELDFSLEHSFSSGGEVDSYAMDDPSDESVVNDEDCNLSDHSSSSSSSLCDDADWKENKRFKSKLSDLLVDLDMPRTHINRLLKFLRKHKSLKFLPSDYRSLLKTMRNVETKKVPPGGQIKYPFSPYFFAHAPRNDP